MPDDAPDEVSEVSVSARLDAVGSACSGCEIGLRRREFVGNMMAAMMGIAGLSRAMGTISRGMVRPVAGSADTRTYPIPAADSVSIDRDNQVILVRWEGVMYAFNLSCPHQNTALRWIDRDHSFQCPKHHSRYTPDGEFVSGRATRGMDRLAIRREGGTVVVDLDSMIKQSDDPAAWKTACVHLG